MSRWIITNVDSKAIGPFTVRVIIKNYSEFYIVNHNMLTDFKTTNDTITRNTLKETIEEFGIPYQLMNLRKMSLALENVIR